ncbi:MAG: hypothetical protein JRD00_05135 [Deltaproteobacteria bacterium]|nr:hypothetical protein [Deltaproteobacteria bacterium]
MKKSMTLLLAGMMLLGMVTVANATTISRYVGNGGFVLFGTSDTAWTTVGQTFRLSEEGVGDDNLLDSVTFWITASDGDIEFNFYLYEWDGAKITGVPLFVSDPMSTGEQAGNPDPTLFTVDVGGVGGVELDVEKDYVFFVSASDFVDGSESQGFIDTLWYFFLSDPTPYNSLVYNINGDDFSLLSTEWNKSPYPFLYDMAFTMELSASGFEPEPEPEPAATAATFELTRAKVDLKKGKIKLDGEIILPVGVTYEDLYREEGSVKLSLFQLNQPVEVVDDDSVELEVKGRNGEKWQYKNRHTFGVTEYKVHWKDDQTGKVKIKADFYPGWVDLSQLTPKLVAEITLGDLEFKKLTIAENGEYDCKLKKKKWDFRNKRNKP